MQIQNAQKLMDQTINELTARGETPALLLHSCCGPCSSYVLEYLAQYFKITVYYYNPNIYPVSEYEKRKNEQEKFINLFPAVNQITFIAAEYDPARFDEVAEGLETQPEGGARCFRCYEMRLEQSAQYAKENRFDYFCSTLSVSPYKNAAKLNEIGGELAEKYGVPYLYADFKKKNGYRRSVELASEYDLYRQHYCGCKFSLLASKAQIED